MCSVALFNMLSCKIDYFNDTHTPYLHPRPFEKREPNFLIFSGHATVGVQEHQAILQEVREFNREKVPIFCLSFGRFADFQLMKTLSLQNHAFTRKIYIAADAALQLEGFYKEV